MRGDADGGGRWFVEAVETDPGARRQGYGRLLLLYAAEHLRSLGAREVTCCISESNAASRRPHESCGFSATGEDPVNP
ncbi:MAG: GNAT family N-acetyltransferase [Acidobacteriota bacterium]|nr:GNAT family N-acetyltransferase [Acidobacteriota bacterium]